MDNNSLAQCLDADARANQTPASSEAGSPLQSWAAVVSVAIAAFAFVATEYLPVGLLPQIARDLDVSPGTAGLMVTTPGIIAAISAPAMMLAAGRINRRLILLALSVLLLASDLVSAIAPTFGVMLLGRALLGASLGGFWTVALAASGRLVPEHYAARASAMIFMGITLATVIGVPLGTFIASLASWRASFVATAILVAIALAAQAALLPSLPAAVAIRLSDLRALLARANPRKSLLVVALGFGAHFTAYTYIAPFLMGNASFSLPAITAVLLGFGLAGFVANFAVSTTVIRHLQKSLFSMLALLMLCLFALPLLHASHAGVTAAVTIWGVAYGAIPLCLSIWMQQSSPDLPEAGSALFVSTVQIAIALGSFGGGEVVDRIGIPATLQLGGALALVALVVIASFRARGARFEDLLAGR